jgi:hypothetical protein
VRGDNNPPPPAKKSMTGTAPRAWGQPGLPATCTGTASRAPGTTGDAETASVGNSPAYAATTPCGLAGAGWPTEQPSRARGTTRPLHPGSASPREGTTPSIEATQLDRYGTAPRAPGTDNTGLNVVPVYGTGTAPRAPRQGYDQVNPVVATGNSPAYAGTTACEPGRLPHVRNIPRAWGTTQPPGAACPSRLEQPRVRGDDPAVGLCCTL